MTSDKMLVSTELLAVLIYKCFYPKTLLHGGCE